MLEVKIPGQRNGHLYRAGEALKQGTVGYIASITTDGYFTIKAPATCTQAALAVYPFKKIRYEEDLSDSASAVETIASGDRLIVFERGGEYITDKLVHTGLTHTGPAFEWDTAAVVTDTAAYTAGGGLVLWAYPSIATGTKGYLQAGTAAACGGASEARQALNRNMIFTRVYAGMYDPYVHASFKILENSPAFSGMYRSSTTGAMLPYSPYYDVSS